MRYAHAGLLVLWLGCGFPHGISAGTGDAPPRDAPRDMPPIDAFDPDAPDARTCFGSGIVTVCFTTPPPADYTNSATTTINTDGSCTQVITPVTGPALCVVAAQTVHINSMLVATGARPLVIVATNTLDIAAGAELDVSSHYLINGIGQIVGQQLGAGETNGATLCGSPTSGGNDSQASTATGAGGGAGASLGGRGGAGARGANNAGGSGGMSVAGMGVTTFVRGGCAGASGGDGDGNQGGAGGHGGGAVYLIAGNAITIEGTINASGQGGRGGAILSGGAGGGSGGFIGLDAPTVMNTGSVFANGGGGGEGGGQTGAGDYGSSGLSATTQASGGSGNQNGGNGGRGAAAAVVNGEAGSTDLNGGGGGGGGIGVIRLYPMQALGGTVSPGPT